MAAIPGLPAAVMAADNSVGTTAVVGAKPNCFKWALPMGAPVKMIVTMKGGSGMAAAQVYEVSSSETSLGKKALAALQAPFLWGASYARGGRPKSGQLGGSPMRSRRAISWFVQRAATYCANMARKRPATTSIK